MPPFIDRVIDGGPGGVMAPDDPLTVWDYLDLMPAGSFPEPSLGYRRPRVSTASMSIAQLTCYERWFAAYVEQMITRDVPAAAPRRDPSCCAGTCRSWRSTPPASQPRQR